MVNLRHSYPITQSEGAKTFVTRLYSAAPKFCMFRRGSAASEPK